LYAFFWEKISIQVLALLNLIYIHMCQDGEYKIGERVFGSCLKSIGLYNAPLPNSTSTFWGLQLDRIGEMSTVKNERGQVGTKYSGNSREQ
jgi:hypothetical protein